MIRNLYAACSHFLHMSPHAKYQVHFLILVWQLRSAGSLIHQPTGNFSDFLASSSVSDLAVSLKLQTFLRKTGEKSHLNLGSKIYGNKTADPLARARPEMRTKHAVLLDTIQLRIIHLDTIYLHTILLRTKRCAPFIKMFKIYISMHIAHKSIGCTKI